MKEKRCKNCLNKFTPFRPLQKVCSPACAYSLAKKKRRTAEQKQERRETRDAKEKLKTKSDWLREDE